MIGLWVLPGIGFTQNTLPDFTVKNNKGKISLIWLNTYAQQVKGISIQRSFDSSKNFSSIGTISNPDDEVNGFMDDDVPYAKMFYRLFIAFDSGAYIFTESQRPEVDSRFDFTATLKKLREINAKNTEVSDQGNVTKQPKISSGKNTAKGKPQKNNRTKKPVTQSKIQDAEPLQKKEVIPYPSRRIFTDRDNNIIISLADFKQNRYAVKFFDEDNKPLFELQKIPEAYLIIEKVNFFHAGWFFFELYKDGALLEKNKFYIAKD